MAQDSGEDWRVQPSRENSLVWLLTITFFALLLVSFGFAIFASFAASAENIELHSRTSDGARG